MYFHKIISSLCVLWITSLHFCFSGTVYIVPFSGYEKVSTFDSGHYAKLKKAINKLGYQCEFISFDSFSTLPTNDLTYIVILNFSHTLPEATTLPYRKYVGKMLSRFKKEKLVLMCSEPESVEPENHNPDVHKLFGKIITCYDSFKGPKYHKYYYYVGVFDSSNPAIPFQKRKLTTLINGCKTSNHPNELYSERLNIINFFENSQTNNFDFYGVGWNKKMYKNYQGEVPNKIETLKKYKFCYCFENIKNVTGYISEKILDCFSAGCVPIYWGATNIDWYIPKGCYILREDFETLQEVYTFIKNMPELKYQEYQNNIKKYLSSDAILLFSCENFIDTILRALFPGYDRTKVFNKQELNILMRVDTWHSKNLKSRCV